MRLFNTLLATAAMISIVSVANASAGAKPAAGFYLGASAGIANSNVKSNVVAGGPFYNNSSTGVGIATPTTSGAEARSTNTDAGKAAGIFGVMAGYNFQSGSMVFGGEIYGGIDSTKLKVYDDSSSGNSTEGALWTSTVKRKSFFGFAPRIGFMVTPSTQLYARLGLEYGKWQARIAPNTASLNLSTNIAFLNEQNGSTTYSTTARTDTASQIAASSTATVGSKNKLSFAPGLGMEVYVGKVFLRGEYSYLMGPKITLTQNTAGYAFTAYNGSTATHTFKTSQHRIQFAVGYKF